MSERLVKRVGHGGAGAVVRGNTLASFDAAVDIGVDMIEFDVRASQGDLVLAHGPLDALLRDCPTLDEALDHLRSQLSLAFTTEDIQEGVRAFFEKRDPSWTGR